MYFLTDEEQMDVNGTINESQIDKFKEVCLFRYKNGNMMFKTGPSYVFVLNTGLRAGEMLGLRWDDISFKKRTVSINRQVLTVSSDNDMYILGLYSSLEPLYLQLGISSSIINKTP